MTVLTDTDLREIMVTERSDWVGTNKNTKLLIKNFIEDNLTPVGYDLSIGEEFVKLKQGIKKGYLRNDEDKLIIKPNEIVAIRTYEDICMPQNKKISGIVVSKVSKVEEGLSHISTSIDPDWKGNFIITIANHSNRKVTLRYKNPFCTVIFLKNESAATKDCLKNPELHFDNLYN